MLADSSWQSNEREKAICNKEIDTYLFYDTYVFH